MSKPAPRWFVLAGLLALAAYGVFIALNTAAVAAGPDSSGYLNSARLLAEGKLTTELRVPPEFAVAGDVNRGRFTPFGFRLSPDESKLVPTYPTGLPLHFAAAGKLLGWHVGPFMVQVAAAIAAIWLMYVAARELGLDHVLAVAGAALLAAFPVFIFTSIQTLSDTLATTWTLAALYAGLRARRGVSWAALGGAAFAIAVLVRPTNLLLAPALLVLLGLDWRKLAVFAAGGIPGAVWLAWYNQQQYGGPLRSGYGDSFEAFALSHGAPTLVHFVKWLALLLPAVVLVLPFAALMYRETRGREWLALVLAAAANIGVYLFYDVSRDVWWCLRFILPGVAALVLASLLGVEAIARRAEGSWPRGVRPGLAMLLIVWAALLSWHWVRNLHVLYVPGYEKAYTQAAELVREHVPREALIVCSPFSGSLYFYTDVSALIYDHVQPQEFAEYVAAARTAHRPIFALLFAEEEEEVLRSRCPGDWAKVATVRNIGLWKLK